MSNRIKPLIAGNWKMNGLRENLSQIETIASTLSGKNEPECEVLICPPVTLLAAASRACEFTLVNTGGQNCHIAEKGAHTGDIGAHMLADAGASYVIVGHSERRSDHHETDGLVREKALATLSAGLVPIICVGETHSERLGALAITVVEHQLDGSVPDIASDQEIVIAYEPVWAIGTGEVPTEDDILRMHASIREWLVKRFGTAGETVRILYGGSMKPENAASILALPNVNGGLIGGASLKAVDFLGIVSAA